MDRMRRPSTRSHRRFRVCVPDDRQATPGDDPLYRSCRNERGTLQGDKSIRTIGEAWSGCATQAGRPTPNSETTAPRSITTLGQDHGHALRKVCPDLGEDIRVSVVPGGWPPPGAHCPDPGPKATH